MKLEIPVNFIQIPPEHWHALLVHFPIALWMTGAIFFALSFSPKFKFFEIPACWMGLVGSLLGYLALEAGEKAESIVGMETCVGELIDKHAENGETAFTFFLGSYVLVAAFLLIRKYVVKKGLPAFVNIVPLVGMVLGGVYLVKAGHEGYELVYKHGVSVHKDAATCKGGSGAR